MKASVSFFSMVLFTVRIALAQSTNSAGLLTTNGVAALNLAEAAATNNPAETTPPPFTTELTRPFEPRNIAPLEPKPNETAIGNLRVSGIAVEAIKTGRPLSLINPFDPPTNSSAEDNVVRDPFNGKVNGLSVFTIRF